MISWRQTVASINKLAHYRSLRFLFVGAINTAFGLVTFPVLYYISRPLKIHYLTVLSVSQIVCIAFAFLTTKTYVFRTKGNHLREVARFSSFHILIFFANLVALPLLVEVVGMSPVWGQMLFSILVVATSYIWHSRFTFRT